MKTKAKSKPKMNYYDEIQGLLLKLPHELQVSFALYCAMDVSHLVPLEHKDITDRCIDLVQRWLKGERLEKELKAAAYAAHAASNASAAYATYAAAAADYAAAYADYAAHAAYAAAYANAAAFSGNSDKMKESYEYLVGMIKDMPKLEKLMWDIDV